MKVNLFNKNSQKCLKLIYRTHLNVFHPLQIYIFLNNYAKEKTKTFNKG